MGELEGSYSVAVRNTVPRGRMAANLPFMVLEVRQLGVVVEPASGILVKFRRRLNAILEPFTRPIPFILGERIGRQPHERWELPWQAIARVAQRTRHALALETSHGMTKTFRFRTSRGLQASLVQLREHGVVTEEPVESRS